MDVDTGALETQGSESLEMFLLFKDLSWMTNLS